MDFVLEEDGKVADTREETFGIRKFTYFVPEKKEFALSVNGVRVFMKGGERHRDPRVCGIEVLDSRLPSSP